MPTGNMDPYVYPGTNVLKNLQDIRDPDRLSKFEMDMTTRRLGELTQERDAVALLLRGER
jgi:fido (protein-threonine AMPylation protein)